MNLEDYRVQIDKVDDELLTLFKQRMQICANIAQYKKEQGLPIMDRGRENEKLSKIGEKAGNELRSYTEKFFLALFELSRIYQAACLEIE